MHATINRHENFLKYIIRSVESYIWLTNIRFGSFFLYKANKKLKKCRDPPVDLN
ncbi:MAG: hypothetical protein PHT94_04575 [Candidatus Nanoarchaeia archaeon]|nr:hypothetical protein [Candidatus Nanoarchaeia archaeon]